MNISNYNNCNKLIYLVSSGANKCITEYIYKDNPVYTDFNIHTPQEEHFKHLYDLLINLNNKKVLLNLKSSHPTINIICKMYLNDPAKLDIKQVDEIRYD